MKCNVHQKTEQNSLYNALNIFKNILLYFFHLQSKTLILFFPEQTKCQSTPTSDFRRSSQRLKFLWSSSSFFFPKKIYIKLFDVRFFVELVFLSFCSQCVFFLSALLFSSFLFVAPAFSMCLRSSNIVWMACTTCMCCPSLFSVLCLSLSRLFYDLDVWTHKHTMTICRFRLNENAQPNT